jgi:hypothetical protein
MTTHEHQRKNVHWESEEPAHQHRRKGDGGMPAWAKRWTWILGLSVSAFASLAGVNAAYGWIYQVQYAPKVDAQIDAKFAPHCAMQAADMKEIAKDINDIKAGIARIEGKLSRSPRSREDQ